MHFEIDIDRRGDADPYRDRRRARPGHDAAIRADADRGRGDRGQGDRRSTSTRSTSSTRPACAPSSRPTRGPGPTGRACPSPAGRPRSSGCSTWSAPTSAWRSSTAASSPGRPSPARGGPSGRAKPAGVEVGRRWPLPASPRPSPGKAAVAPAARKRPAPPAPGGGPAPAAASRPPGRPFALEQRHYDVLGLGLVAFGVFLGVIFYTAADGGRGGHGVSTGPRLAARRDPLRRARWPCVAIGGLFVLRPVLPSVKPFRTGTILLFCALTLALAANTLGVAPAGTRNGFWQPSFFETHGGIVGEAELWAASHLIGTHRRPHPRRLPRRRRRHPPHRGRRGRPDARRRREHGRRDAHPPRPAGRLPGRPGPAAAAPRAARPARAAGGELIVRATHVEAPPMPYDGEPDLADPAQPRPQTPSAPSRRGDPDARRGGARPGRSPSRARRRRAAAATTPGPSDLTPQGRYRGSVTDDPDFVWRLPQAERPDPVERRAVASGHRRPGEDRRQPDRGARPLRRRRHGHRHGRRAAHHPLRAPPGPGDQGRQGRPAQGRPGLRPGRHRHPHPRADPRQAGRRRRGPERPPADRPPRRRLPEPRRPTGRP